jgi:hypothetical protein
MLPRVAQLEFSFQSAPNIARDCARPIAGSRIFDVSELFFVFIGHCQKVDGKSILDFVFFFYLLVLVAV